MKKVLILSLVLFLTLTIVGTAAAQTEVRIAGFGGNDQAIVEELLARFVEPELEEDIEFPAGIIKFTLCGNCS